MNAREIKKVLKEQGFNLKDFSVCVRNCTYDVAVTVTIKNPYVNKIEIEKIMKRFKEIDYDEYTGEILAGGNTYVHVMYDYEIFDEVSKTWTATAMGVMRDSKHTVMSIFDGLFYIHNKQGKDEIRQDNEKAHCTLYVNDENELSIYLFKFATFGQINI